MIYGTWKQRTSGHAPPKFVPINEQTNILWCINVIL